MSPEPFYDGLIGPFRDAYHRGEVPLGTKVKVHTIDRGTHERIQRQAHNLRSHLLVHLDRTYALGLFSTSALKSPDPAGGYDIFIAYYGEAKTAAMKGKWKAQRRRKIPVSRSSEG